MKSIRIPILFVLLSAAVIPLQASQFVELPFDVVAREATYAVRGTVIDTWSAWDDDHRLIYTYATLRVHRYFGDATGPDTLVIREVGGVVDGYEQVVPGFPALRRGEDTVLLLSQWPGSADLRIHAYNQGKYLVRGRAGAERLIPDPVKQGDEVSSQERPGRRLQVDAADPEEDGLRIEEFATMVAGARGELGAGRQQQQ